jgi:putative membrane protein
MLLEILLFMLLGISIGVLTGLLPGLHPNTVLVLVLSLSALFAAYPTIYILVFIISLSVSNVFLDFIPSILFGAPDPDSCLSVLPGHQMLMEGRGYEAVLLSVTGGMCAMVATALTLPLLLFAIPAIYSQMHSVIYILLILAVLWMVWTEPGYGKAWAGLIFLSAGLFGLVTLNTLSDQALFPALTGLFGISGLIVSFYGKSVIPQQQKVCSIGKGTLKGSMAGWFAGMASGLLPGLGTSQAAAVAGQVFRAKTKDFLSAIGGINTANIIFTLIAFYTIGKTRSGAVSAIAQIVPSISQEELVLLMVISLATTFISVFLVLKTSWTAAAKLHSISYRKTSLSIIVFLVCAVIILSGLLGILIACAATLLGIAAIKLGVKRSHMMGFLILPTILYFSGGLPVVSHLLGI